MNTFINNMKEVQNLDYVALLKDSILKNILLVAILWFFGTTVIGIPIVFGIVAFRGFCLGYTISSSIAVLGTGKGVLFFTVSILLQNLIFIPCMLALAVSRNKAI